MTLVQDRRSADDFVVPEDQQALTSAVAHFGPVRTLPSTRHLVRAQVLPVLSAGCFQYVVRPFSGVDVRE
jgi:hypothetical protein